MFATSRRFAKQVQQLRRRHRRRIAALSLLALVVAGCGAPDHDLDTAQQKQAVLGGYVDELTSGVVGLALQAGQHPLVGHCSGALIAPNLVLTARHCVMWTDPAQLEDVICGEADLGKTLQAGSIVVSPNTRRPTDVSDPSYIRGSRVFVAPGATDLCGFDLALLLLEESFDAAQAEPLTPRIDEMAQNNEVFSAAGYGLTRPESDSSSGVRMRTDQRSVMCTLATCASFDWPVVDGKEWLSQDANICSGDSGGPALDARGRVIGVASRGPSTCDAAIYGDVAAWGDFIIDVAVAAAEQGGYPAPHWTSGSSERLPFETPAPAIGPAAADEPPLGSSDDGTDLAVDEAMTGPADSADCGALDECGDGALARESACALPSAPGRGRGVPVSVAMVAVVAFAAALRRRR